MQQRNETSGKTAAITFRDFPSLKGSSYKERRMRSSRCSIATVVVALGLMGVGLVGNANAQTIETGAPTTPGLALQPDLEPLDVEALTPGSTPAFLVSANTVSPTQLTVPSLWWLRDQLADQETYGNRLLENWLAYPTGGSSRPGRVDLVVNRQLWSLLDYLDRYAFIHRFGEVARDYGYNVRVFDGNATLLGASTCDFSTINIDALQSRQFSERAEAATLLPNPATTIACSILLDSSGKAGLRGGTSQPFGGGAAKALDIAKP
ncbi:MAG: hypothetical protein RBJ76_25620 [Stenomitos frigidus ULC029]